MTNEEMERMVDAHVAQLREHFDSVRIFTTINNPRDDGSQETAGVSRGSGNFYAQLGQITEWMQTSDQQARNWISQPDEE